MDSCLNQWDVKPFRAGGAGASRLERSFVGGKHGAEKLLLKCSWSPDQQKVACGSADRCSIKSHHITSHHVYDITSHDITSYYMYDITSHDIITHHITSHHIISYQSYYIISYDIVDMKNWTLLYFHYSSYSSHPAIVVVLRAYTNHHHQPFLDTPGSDTKSQGSQKSERSISQLIIHLINQPNNL